QDAELEAVIAFFAGAAELVFARRLVGRGGEVLVAAPAPPGARDDKPFVGMGEVVDQCAGIGVVEQRANRDFKDSIFAILAGAVGSHTVLAAFGFVLRIEAEVDEGVVALAGF